MYFAVENKNKIGVVDTKDRVLEVYTKSEVEQFRKQGITVLSESDMKQVLHFLRHYMLNMNEFGGGSEFDMLLSYACDKGSNVWGGSHFDYAKSFKDDYKRVKSLGFDIDISDLYCSRDLFIQDYLKMYGFVTIVEKSLEMDFKTREKRKSEITQDFCRRWHLPPSFKEDVVY